METWFDKIINGVLIAGVATAVVFLFLIMVFPQRVLGPPPEPLKSPEKYLCLTYTDDHIVTTDHQLSQSGQMLFGHFLETKDRVVVNRADIKVCGLTRQ